MVEHLGLEPSSIPCKGDPRTLHVPRLGLPRGPDPCSACTEQWRDGSDPREWKVPGVGFEPTSPRLQRGAFTRSASQANSVGAADGNRTHVCALATHGSATELRTLRGAQGRIRTCRARRHLIYNQASLPLEDLCVVSCGRSAVARSCVGGRLTVRPPPLRVPTRFQDGLPATPAEPSVPDVSARIERATSAFGRRRPAPLSYETKLCV